MTTTSSQLKRPIGVICQYEWKDPFTGERLASSCFIKVHCSSQIQSRFQAKIDEIGRGSAKMTTFVTENGRERF